jgi:lantibiotic modifying enzyme
MNTTKEIDKITGVFNEKLLSQDYSKINLDGLFEGKLGIVFYLFHMYKLDKNENYLNKISEILNSLFTDVSEGKSYMSVSGSFSQGLSGLGYITKELIEYGILEEDAMSFFEEVNEFVYASAVKDIGEGNFDFMNGVPGALFYFDRINHKYTADLIEKMHLKYTSEKYPFYNYIDEPYNKGINFGIAHGILGVLLVLLEIFKKDKSCLKVKNLISHCTTLILESKKEKQINGNTIYYPYNIHYDESNTLISNPTNRMAWCSGDLVVALTLYKAGIVLERTDCIDVSNKLGLACIQRRNVEVTGIHLPIFCHGTSGAAVLYKKLYEISNNRIYLEEYEFWFSETIKYLKTEILEDTNDNYYSLLYGHTAPLLAVNSANSSIKNWKKIFLI